jgi:hypothetical protein
VVEALAAGPKVAHLCSHKNRCMEGEYRHYRLTVECMAQRRLWDH